MVRPPGPERIIGWAHRHNRIKKVCIYNGYKCVGVQIALYTFSVLLIDLLQLASLIVPDVNISVNGSSCNFLFLVQFSLFWGLKTASAKGGSYTGYIFLITLSPII